MTAWATVPYVEAQLVDYRSQILQVVVGEPKACGRPAGRVVGRLGGYPADRGHASNSLGLTRLLEVSSAISMSDQSCSMASAFGKGSEVRASRVAHCQ